MSEGYTNKQIKVFFLELYEPDPEKQVNDFLAKLSVPAKIHVAPASSLGLVVVVEYDKEVES